MSIYRAKNTAIADIKYLRLHTCSFILPPKGPDGPSAVGGKLNPPVLEFELMKNKSINIYETKKNGKIKFIYT